MSRHQKILPIFVINLTTDVDRKQHMQVFDKKHHLGMDFVEAVDGKTLTKAQIKIVYSKVQSIKNIGREMSAGEIACALSHRLIYQKILDNDIKAALILEDDAWFDNQLLDFLTQLDYLDKNWELLLLGHSNALSRKQKIKYNFWYKKILNNNIIRRPAEIGYGTHGYCITNNGAKKMLKHTKIIAKPIDHYTGNCQYTNLYIVQQPIVQIDIRLGLLSNLTTQRLEINKNSHNIPFKKKVFNYFGLQDLYSKLPIAKNAIKAIWFRVKPLGKY